MSWPGSVPSSRFMVAAAKRSVPSRPRMKSHGLIVPRELKPLVAFTPPLAAGENWPKVSSDRLHEGAAYSAFSNSSAVTSEGGSSVVPKRSANHCMWLFEKSMLPSLPPVPSKGGNRGSPPVTTTAESNQASASSGRWFRQAKRRRFFSAPFSGHDPSPLAATADRNAAMAER